jgi:hypothetical protein
MYGYRRREPRDWWGRGSNWWGCEVLTAWRRGWWLHRGYNGRLLEKCYNPFLILEKNRIPFALKIFNRNRVHFQKLFEFCHFSVCLEFEFQRKHFLCKVWRKCPRFSVGFSWHLNLKLIFWFYNFVKLKRCQKHLEINNDFYFRNNHPMLRIKLVSGKCFEVCFDAEVISLIYNQNGHKE